ncbi:hypothetical protein CYK37_26020 [Mesorhizobium loti]|nr:hypothetical protein [Mesorhizobium loti]PLP56241.1 hypothetical protein CYK37_26020 [Mesorhizobium loti]
MTEPASEPRGAFQRIPARDMADALERMANGKTSLSGRMILVRKVCNFSGSCSGWLTDFGHGRRKRPDHEIQQKRQELQVLQQAAFDYRAQEPFQEKPEPLRVSAKNSNAPAERGARP